MKNFNNNKFNYENKLHETENKNKINKTCFIENCDKKSFAMPVISRKKQIFIINKKYLYLL